MQTDLERGGCSGKWFFEQLINLRTHTYLIVFACSPIVDSHAAGVNVGNDSFSNCNLVKYSGGNRNGSAEQLYLFFGPDGGELARVLFEADLLRESFERRRADHYAADVVAHQEFVWIAAGVLILDSLQAEHVERRRFTRNELTRTFTAGRQAIAFVQRARDHDPLRAVHQVHGRGVLIRNPDSKFQTGKALFLRLLVIGAYDRDHFFCQNSGTRYSQAGFTFALVERKNHCVAFNKNRRCIVLRQKLIDRLVEIQAEV